MFPPLTSTRTRLQWHRACKQAGDPQFSTARILEGLTTGAALEIDLVLSGDGHFVIMHDETLDRETTGRGPVDAMAASDLKRLFRRDGKARVLNDNLALLSDITRLAAAAGLHEQALLHLDYKLDNAALSDDAIARFTAAIAPLRGQVLLTTGDLAALSRLAEAEPALRIGFDPMETSCMQNLLRTRDFDRFADDVVAACPRAEMVALQFTLLEESAMAGFDLVGAFRARGRWVDAYTVRGSLPHHVALAGFLAARGVTMIAADDPAGLHAHLADRVALSG